ncbi:TPA: helix-turn-helix transcriptional regulator [Staphylococcus aureus]|uniref:helix-turn-helix domain-containing protein n=2 Tax=Staphylococcus aureus TaxID=1280 RepID=UPI0020C72563|nr:helix-turn-helix transcriptional regulator [Staphylococcus aureus]
MYEFNVKRMKAERIAKGISISDMAKKLGMTPGTYSKKENGHIRINVDDLAKVIEVLELPQDKCGIFLLIEFPKCQHSKNKHLKRRTQWNKSR